MAISALEGSRNVEDLMGLTEPVCTATPTPGVHEVCLYENLFMQYTEIFKVLKMKIFNIKLLIFFSYFCSKHRLWIHVRTASARRF